MVTCYCSTWTELWVMRGHEANHKEVTEQRGGAKRVQKELLRRMDDQGSYRRTRVKTDSAPKAKPLSGPTDGSK